MIYVVVSFEYSREPRPGEKTIESWGKKTTERRTFGQELLGPFETPAEANKAAAEYEDTTRVVGKSDRVVGHNYRFSFIELDGIGCFEATPVEVPKLCSWQSGKKLLTFKNFPSNAPGTPIAWDEDFYWSRCLPEWEATHKDQTVGVHTRDLEPGMVLRNPNGGWYGDLILEKVEPYDELWAENVEGLRPEHPDETKEIL